MATNLDDTLLPDIAIPPGELLREELECRGISVGEFARRICIMPEGLERIFLGEKAITQDVADAIERELGVSAYLWLKMEARYQLILSRLAEQESASQSVELMAEETADFARGADS